MSSMELIATPTLPTSPSARAWSESYPICVGRSKAHDRPVEPAASSSFHRSLVALALPNPEYCRMVHKRPRYMSLRTPRVYGYEPGSPSFSSGFQPSRSDGRYTGLIWIPESVKRSWAAMNRDYADANWRHLPVDSTGRCRQFGMMRVRAR